MIFTHHTGTPTTKTPSAEEQPGATIVLSKQRQFTFSPLVRQVAGGFLHGRTITRATMARKARQQRKQSEANHANS